MHERILLSALESSLSSFIRRLVVVNELVDGAFPTLLGLYDFFKVLFTLTPLLTLSLSAGLIAVLNLFLNKRDNDVGLGERAKLFS